MLRKSITSANLMLQLMPMDKRRIWCITNFILIQCVIVIVLGSTVLNCVWVPSLINFDPYKLASVMYLYDKRACGNMGNVAKVVSNLRLSNDTRGFNVLPIRWEPAIVTVSTKLSRKTRTYIELSTAIHLIWILLTVAFKMITNQNDNTQLINFALNVYFYTLIFVIIFDISMGIVYVTHIKQSLTKGMIVRYSGWSVELKLKSHDDFAGYLPMIASACWMRGLVVLALNIFSCKKLNDMRCKRKSKAIMTNWDTAGQRPFPEANDDQELASDTLYYRAGENKPYVQEKFIGFYY